MYLLSKKDKDVLKSFKESLVNHRDNMLGYPMYCKPPMSDDVKDFLDFTLNNLGDPFVGTNYSMNTFDFEKEVISFFASLYNINNYWGYVTSCGSEGNFKGLSLAYTKYPNGIVYYSNKSHYSVKNSIDYLSLQSKEIKTNSDHSIDINDLKEKIDSSRPIILNLNIGTTMAGAIDDIYSIVNEFDACIHLDCALFGGMLPFINGPKIDFSLPINSISISGHKFFGCSFPCGIIITHPLESNNKIEYINSCNSTIFGSRNGLAPLMLWCSIKGYGIEGFKNLAENCLELTDYAFDKILELFPESWKNGYSNTIMLPKPSESVIKKWQLATEGEWSHIIIMPHVTKENIDLFVEDLVEDLVLI